MVRAGRYDNTVRIVLYSTRITVFSGRVVFVRYHSSKIYNSRVQIYIAICNLALLTQLKFCTVNGLHLSCHIPFLKEVTRFTRTTLFGRGYVSRFTDGQIVKAEPWGIVLVWDSTGRG